MKIKSKSKNKSKSKIEIANRNERSGWTHIWKWDAKPIFLTIVKRNVGQFWKLNSDVVKINFDNWNVFLIIIMFFCFWCCPGAAVILPRHIRQPRAPLQRDSTTQVAMFFWSNTLGFAIFPLQMLLYERFCSNMKMFAWRAERDCRNVAGQFLQVGKPLFCLCFADKRSPIAEIDRQLARGRPGFGRRVRENHRFLANQQNQQYIEKNKNQ